MKAKTIVITGASSGIGRAAADACLAAGYRVIATARAPGHQLAYWRPTAVADQSPPQNFSGPTAVADQSRFPPQNFSAVKDPHF